MVNRISETTYIIQASVEAGLLRMAIQFASEGNNGKPLQQVIEGLIEIKERRDRLILGSRAENQAINQGGIRLMQLEARG